MKLAILVLSTISILISCKSPVRDEHGNCVPNPKIECSLGQKSECEVVSEGCKRCFCVDDSATTAAKPKPPVNPQHSKEPHPGDRPTYGNPGPYPGGTYPPPGQ